MSMKLGLETLKQIKFGSHLLWMMRDDKKKSSKFE